MATGGDSVNSERNCFCTICQGAESCVAAFHFCVSCEQYLCGECKQHHSRVKATKLHQVVGTDEIPSFNSLTLGSEAMETSLCTEHQRQFEYFCAVHMDVLCKTCKLIEHKACEKIIELGKAVGDVFSEENSKHILKSMKELINYFSKCKDTFQSGRDQLIKSKQSAMDKVKQIRKKIDSQFDTIEAAAYEDIDRCFKKEAKQFEDRLHVCDITILQLQKRISKLERALAFDDKESEFVTANEVIKEIKRQCNLLKVTIEDMYDVDFTFKVNDNIFKIIKMLPFLGDLSVTKSPACTSDMGTVVIYTGEIKPRTSTDTKAPVILSHEKLSDGRQLITDNQNKKLKLYDSNDQFLSELVLPGLPSFVVLLCDSEAVVSLPDINSLQYITIGTDLALSETTKVDYKPVAMVKYGGDILATVVNDVFWKVVVIDKHGTVKRTIYQDNGSLFSEPYFIDLSVDQKTVYVVDIYKGCIGLSMDGNVSFQYRDQKVKGYGGLAVGRDCLFIGVRKRNGANVRRLSLSGNDAKDMDLGKTWPLKIMDNNLIIHNIDNKGERPIEVFYLL